MLHIPIKLWNKKLIEQFQSQPKHSIDGRTHHSGNWVTGQVLQSWKFSQPIRF